MIVSVKAKLDSSKEEIFDLARKQSGLGGTLYFSLLKKSLDARKKTDIHYVYSIEVSDKPQKEESEDFAVYAYPNLPVVVVGFGPCGMFCALKLARAGFKPIVLEQGSNVDERKIKCERFFASRVLDEDSNVQFGEGGAGAFSDGKLNTGVKSEFKRYVLRELVKHGAPSEIEYDAKPHIGSDILPKVVKNIRNEIIALGGQVIFDCKVTYVLSNGGSLTGLVVKKNGSESVINTQNAIFAIGHSSRQTYRMLSSVGVAMEQKDCAIGMRVEHLQRDINVAQFGKEIGVSADYKLATTVDGRGVFSFCMCPGGVVMASASENGGVVTNGMSEYARDGINSNSAIVCQLKTSDYSSSDVFAGMDLIESIERKAFINGGKDFSAPCVNVEDFLQEKRSIAFKKVKPSYAPSVAIGDGNGVLPSFITERIRGAFKDFDRKIKGFAQSGVLTLPETRTSSPVRILRGEDYQAIGLQGLYPAGETGYAGGITSSAIDGIKVAFAIMKKYEN